MYYDNEWIINYCKKSLTSKASVTILKNNNDGKEIDLEIEVVNFRGYNSKIYFRSELAEHTASKFYSMVGRQLAIAKNKR